MTGSECDIEQGSSSLAGMLPRVGDPHLALYLRQCPGQAGTLGRIRLAGIPCNLCQSQHGLTACWATPSARCQRHSVRQQLTKPLLLPVTQHRCDSAIAGCPAATPGAGPILTPISALPPSSCQHHQKEHLTENKPFFFPSGSCSSFIAGAGQVELSAPEPHSSV